jgi:hypothetical protein
MEKRALLLALALTLPLAIYGIPYAYAISTSSTYTVDDVKVVSPHSTVELVATCNPGDYATGGGYDSGFEGGLGAPVYALASFSSGGVNPNSWNVFLLNPNDAASFVTARVICQTPITVAGVTVPEFGSLYLAIALGAVVYFMLSRHFMRRPAISAAKVSS